MHICITHNQPQIPVYGEEKDRISEEAVLKEVTDVQKALTQLDHHVKILPLKRDVDLFIQQLSFLKPECIFNLCEGAYGLSKYEMNVSSLFELLGIPYTGSPPLALGNCLDKIKTKYILLGAKLPTPKFEVVCNISELKGTQFLPAIVKPTLEDGSRGISGRSVIYNECQLENRIEYILTTYNQPAMIESFIDGKELNVSLIGNESPKVLSISEIDLSKLYDLPRVVTYEGKWDENSHEYINTPMIYPAKINGILRNKIERISKKAYKIMGCMGYARIDFRVDCSSTPYIIDINPNPDISRKAGFAKSVKKSGLIYNELIQKIVKLAYVSNLKSYGTGKRILIRKMLEKDIPIIIRMLRDVGVFGNAEINIATEIINSYLKNPDSRDYFSYVADYSVNRTIGYICFGQTPLTDGIYDIYWIAVDRRFQKIGVGGKLLNFAEDYVRSREGRKIIIETSSKKEYESARSLYKRAGYGEVARISDFYSSNDDKIIFGKDLT
jgi:D-alanine-D-alanine ligase